MKQRTIIPTLILLLLASTVFGQITLERQVIGSTGGFSTGTGMTISSTVGEAVVQTLFSSNTILTQGFQQPESTNDSIVDFEIVNESCPGAHNGSIYIKDVKGCPGPYGVVIRSVLDTTTIVGQDTLATGDYNVMIIGSNGCSYAIILFVGLDSDEDCKLHFYHGITPNNDGKNDKWIIENIEMFPENVVRIFNRWGHEVWYGENYDNVEVVWEGINNEGNEMADATYFYIAVVNGETYKGWVELTR